MSGAEFLAWSVDAAFVMVMVSVALGFVRLAKGPTLADRVVALDMMTVIIVAFCGLYAIFAGEAAFLDVGIVLALVGFLATVALARFAERARLRDGETEDRT
jgi:multisubunit Na+/H+ antiporter MnhF subunit